MFTAAPAFFVCLPIPLKGLPMTVSPLFRSALLLAGEAVVAALGAAEKQLVAVPDDAVALASKGVLLGMLACHGRTGNRDSYVPTAIGLMNEALQKGDARDAVLRWTVGMGLAALPLEWGQTARAVKLLQGALGHPSLMRWQRLFGLAMLSGLCQDAGDAAGAREAYAAAKATDPQAAPDLFLLFMDRRAGCEARP
jgi:hypothetical protein